jgi:hypothetical protein
VSILCVLQVVQLKKKCKGKHSTDEGKHCTDEAKQDIDKGNTVLMTVNKM